MYTVLGYSLGMLAWSALVTLINVLTAVFVIAVEFYAALALFGALVFAGIGVRRLIARHIRKTGPGETNRSPSDITPPIVVADAPECRFYRSSAAAVTARLTPHTKVFDAHGHRLVAVAGGLRVSPADRDGAEELAELLRGWLGYMDAIRWSVADWDLPLLLQASVEHLGYSD